MTKEEVQQRQQDLRDAVDQYENSLPLVIRLAESQAAAARAKYLAFVRAGFTEDQALKLCGQGFL